MSKRGERRTKGVGGGRKEEGKRKKMNPLPNRISSTDVCDSANLLHELALYANIQQ